MSSNNQGHKKSGPPRSDAERSILDKFAKVASVEEKCRKFFRCMHAYRSYSERDVNWM